MARHHGKTGLVLMSTSSATVATAVTLSKWSLNLATDKVEVTSFGDANKTYVQGLKDVQGSLSGSWDDTDTQLFPGGDSTTGVKLYLYPDFTNSPTKYWYGPAWIDPSIDVDINGAVTVTASFAANGSWGRL
jgi:hypothetical protein